jgi:multiple sugar transport system permease protein
MWMFHPELGLINVILNFFGIPPFGWYTSIEGAIPTVILLAVWQATGYYMVIFLAGLNGISSTYYEAASIDGAGKVCCFFKITLPLLTPTLFFVFTMMLISGFQVFNEVFMLTRGGPANASRTIVLQIYDTAFQYFRMGEAAVYSWILFIIIFIVTILQFKFSKRWVTYDV